MAGTVLDGWTIVAPGRELDRRFEAVVFDWDGTAVPGRDADASRIRALVEDLCATGMHLVVVSGTHVGNVDGQLAARPRGPGGLHYALNRGSELFAVGADGPALVARREATSDERAALDRAAALTVDRLAQRGLRAEVVSERLNRRKIDVIPTPEWVDPPKARIDELLLAVEDRLHAAGFGGLPDVVALASAAARDAGLAEPKVTSDGKHVEIGLTDKGDSAVAVLGLLQRFGISPGQVLVAGDEVGPLGGLPGSDSLLLVGRLDAATALSVGVEPNGVPDGVLHRPGGPEVFVAILDDQLARRRAGEPPVPDARAGWTLAFGALDEQRELAREALLTLADGTLGSSGAPLFAHPATAPTVLANGVFDGDGPETDLLDGPRWDRLGGVLRPGDRVLRVLDVATGVLHEWIDADGTRLAACRFSSFATPGLAVLRVRVIGGELPPGSSLVPPEGRRVERGTEGDDEWMVVRGEPGSIAAVAKERSPVANVLERVVAYDPRAVGSVDVDAARRRASDAAGEGFDALLAQHRAAWASRWARAEVVIDGDPSLQLATRVALYHLMGTVPDRGVAAVGARGLTGHAYRGHVFWDADTFVLPFFAATCGPAARAMLEYRVERLPAALDAARSEGRAGARFPWESAHDGTDVTPRSARDDAGRLVPIRTGTAEVHIVADVAWAASSYLEWTGDDTFAAGPAHELFVETARYWAARIRLDPRGRGHIYGVIGPDEYHEPVDDSAFTNVMARWNLRRAAASVEAHRAPGVRPGEVDDWRHLAAVLVDGFDAPSGIYEQFSGFYLLEPVRIAELSTRPVNADQLLGREPTRAAQVVKQADVLMLHHLVPDEVAPGSLVANLDFYEPRTAHGSSLSPAVHASLLARAGRLDEAVAALRVAATLDLDDTTRTSDGGVHLATMGGVWQALAYGFAGLRARRDGLVVDPRLPRAWEGFEVNVVHRGIPVRVRVEPDVTTVTAEDPVTVHGAGRRAVADRAGLRFPTVPASPPGRDGP